MHISVTKVGASLWDVPTAINQEIFQSEINRVVTNEARVIRNQMARPTATWDHPVLFEVDIRYVMGDPEVTVYTEDMIYYFLDRGTEVRYATMSYDPLYIPKTTPYSLRSRPGEGYLLFVNKNYPHPGIEARMFTQVVYDNRLPKFEANIQRAITRAIRKSGLRW